MWRSLVVVTHGERLLEDFFVHNLLGQEPPDWNRELEHNQPTGNWSDLVKLS